MPLDLGLGFLKLLADSTMRKSTVAEHTSMVNITIIELNVEDGSFWANMPFSNASPGDEEEMPDEETEDEDEDESGGGKGLALVGVLLFLVVVAAVVKYLSGDEPEVEVDTDEDSVDVSIDD
jgi:hypothetical protein